MVTINGKDYPLEHKNLLDYLLENGFNPALIAIEINLKILPKKEYANYSFSEGDKVEIVRFVGGG